MAAMHGFSLSWLAIPNGFWKISVAESLESSVVHISSLSAQ
jgi:hypothetical protein